MFTRILASVVLFSLIASCASTIEDNTPAPLWMHIEGEGAPTIVFISGNGNDASAWSTVEPEIRNYGVRTVVYDRAGLGHSPLNQKPYRIDDEALALKQTLNSNNVRGPYILAAHSYGGLIAAITAQDNPDVVGVVLVDALLPGDLSDDVVQNVLAEYTPHFDMLKQAAPDLAKAIIPVIEAYPETAARMKTVRFSPSLPVIDILADTTWVSSPDDIEHIRQVHENFAAAAPMRKTVHAISSGHNVMRDRPDIVIQSVADMIAALRAANE